MGNFFYVNYSGPDGEIAGIYPGLRHKSPVSCLEARSIVSSDRHIMTRRLRRRSPALVVDLRCGDVPMAEQFLHLGDVYAGIEQ